MRTRRNGAALLFAAVASLATVLTLAGCVQPAPRVIPTAEPSSAPVFASNAEALAAAKKAYVAYLAVSDQILIDGGRNPERLLTVATSTEYKEQLPGFTAAADKGWRSTGGTRIEAIVLQRFDPVSQSGHEVVSVYACIDVSEVDVIDQGGNSVVSADRPSTSTFQASFDLSRRKPPSLIMADEKQWQGKGICPA